MALPHRHHHCCHLRGHVHYNGVLVQALAVTVERSAQHFQRKEMHVALNVIFMVIIKSIPCSIHVSIPRLILNESILAVITIFLSPRVWRENWESPKNYILFPVLELSLRDIVSRGKL